MNEHVNKTALSDLLLPPAPLLLKTPNLVKDLTLITFAVSSLSTASYPAEQGEVMFETLKPPLPILVLALGLVFKGCALLLDVKLTLLALC